MDKLECKLSSESTNIASMSAKDDLSCALQKMHVTEMVDENVNSLDVNLNNDSMELKKKRRPSMDRSRYKELRKWKKVGKGKLA